MFPTRTGATHHRPNVGEAINGIKRHLAIRHPLRFMLAAAVILVLALAIFPGYVEKWLWMKQLDYAQIFWTLLSVRWGMFLAAFLVTFVFLWLNLRHAAKTSGDYSIRGQAGATGVWSRGNLEARRGLSFSPRLMMVDIALASAAAALLFGAAYYAEWDSFIRFRFGGTFGVSDPLFGTDVGFYVFRLPFYELLQTSVMLLSALTLMLVLMTYLFFGSVLVKDDSRKIAASDNASRHLSGLLFILVAAWGWGFYLNHFELLYSTQGVVYGAGYTAYHVTRVALWVMVAASVVACLMLALNFVRPNLKTFAAGAGGYVALWLIGIVVAPYCVQKFIVQPNELALETPYLKHSIDYTRQSYDLDAIQETSYAALPDLTHDVIARNQDTIQNVRLWDARPLLQTYRQTQAIRLYYQFYNVDTDRYQLPDGYHQVMLSARELSPELPAKAQTWVNQYLQFTHGNGAVMNFVSKTVGNGFPQYVLEDVPAQSNYGLKVTQPEIYYGEAMPGYRIVSTSVKEFDYPKGNDNVYKSYAGTGGIPLNDIWKRLLFAWTKADINILLTSYLTPESRIQIHRNVHERVTQIAPFLHLDNDPYAVLSEGKLYWIQDAYTTSNRYPYATPERTWTYQTPFEQGVDRGFSNGSSSQEPRGTESHSLASFDGLNYIRNSVKVVVDMYDGSVRFFIMDPKDPILAAYRQAFPDVFSDLGDLSADLKKHLRYPENLFSIQADQYRTFHMTDPQVFYNREDLWAAPKETYAGDVQSMEPYYILAKLPGSDQLEYMLMTPFTPQNRDNMISWMAARSDFPQYGKMLFYQLPKEKLVYGPNQIEAMIDQNTTISQQLTLWNQNGSRVIRGKQIVTPIENSFLYVVPLYLTAQGANFPQLKRVIAVAGDKVVMEPTLDEALSALFGTPQTQSAAKKALTPPAVPAPVETAPLANQPAIAEPPVSGNAKRQFDDAQQAMQHGDWKKFGKSMDALKRLLASPVVR